MAEETETLPAETAAPESGPGLSDAPSSPPVVAEPTGAEPQVSPDSEQLGAEQPEAETPEPSWRQAETFDAVRETPEFTEWKQEYDEDQEHTLRTEIGRTNRKITTALEGWTDQGNKLSRELTDHVVDLQETIKTVSDDRERRQAQGALDESLSKLSQQFIASQSWSMAMTVFEQFLETKMPGFYSAHQEEFWDATAMNQEAAMNPAAMRPALERLATRFFREHDKALRASVREEVETQERGRKDKESAAGERQRGAAPAKVSGRGGETRSDREVLLDPSTPPSKLKEIRDRQRYAES